MNSRLIIKQQRNYGFFFNSFKGASIVQAFPVVGSASLIIDITHRGLSCITGDYRKQSSASGRTYTVPPIELLSATVLWAGEGGRERERERDKERERERGGGGIHYHSIHIRPVCQWTRRRKNREKQRG